MNSKPTLDYVAHVRADAARMSNALRTDADADVPTCPGWSIERLVAHTGSVHHMAIHAIEYGEPPADRDALRPGADDDLADWFDRGVDQLAAALTTIDAEAPTWHPFPTEQVAALWPRRMAHETSIHRWDAEHALGSTAPIDPHLAADGIDEYFSVIVPRLATTRGLPTASLHVHCTDVDGEWLVYVDDEGYQLVRAHEKGDAALRGPAEQLLLALWARDRGGDALSPVGDDAALAAWLDLGGNCTSVGRAAPPNVHPPPSAAPVA